MRHLFREEKKDLFVVLLCVMNMIKSIEYLDQKIAHRILNSHYSISMHNLIMRLHQTFGIKYC